MAQDNIKSWNFVSFARENKTLGKMRVVPFSRVDEKSGTLEHWKKLCWVSPDEVDDEGKPVIKLYVGFSKNLGELTAEEIKARRNELRVIQQENGIYKLCSVAGEAVDDSWLDEE